MASVAAAVSVTNRKTLKALYAYRAAEPDELSFAEGDTVYVDVKDAIAVEDWWEVTHENGKKGAVPKAYFSGV